MEKAKTKTTGGPDFIGIGVNKAATSWIFNCLREHPEVCVSKPKEINFFNQGYAQNYEKGLAWYSKHFTHCDSQKIIGEYSPNYLHDPAVPARIHEHYPNAKLIVCLRNPVDRILSAFYFNLARGKHNYASVRERLEKDPRADIEKGFYYKHISRFLSFFPREQVFITVYDDIQRNPVAFIQQMYTFLGARGDFIPQAATKRINITAENRLRIPVVSRTLYSVRKYLLKHVAGKYLMRAFEILGIKFVARQITKWNLRKTNLRPLKTREIDNETRAWLENMYKEDTKRLEQLLGRKLNWL